MKFKPQHAPHISFNESTKSLMGNVALVLLVLYGMAFYFYGPRVLLLGVISITICWVTDWVCQLLFDRDPKAHDLSPLVTGLIIPLMMSAAIPFQVVVLAAIFAIVVAKHPFGGVGHNIFNPAAAGYAFAVTCYPASVIFRYPVPRSIVPLFPTEAMKIMDSSAFSLGLGGVPSASVSSLALGDVAGPMGATHHLVIFACLIFLVSRRTLRWETPIFFLGTTTIIAFLFQRAPITPLWSVFHENMSGLLMFGAVFMLGDPVTTPSRRLAKIGHAVLCGIIVMLYRHVGKLEEGFVFALLLMNAAVWGFDMLAEKYAQHQRRLRRSETFRSPQISKKA